MSIKDFQDDAYLRLVRPLVQAYLAFYRVGSRHIEEMGVTPAQFDVIAELGDTSGMTCADLSEATLITKGTLTGVLDRLVAKGFVRRDDVAGDRRAIRVKLTPKGEGVFRKIFPAHAEFLRPFLKRALTPQEVELMRRKLFRLRDSFEGRGSESRKAPRARGKGSTVIEAISNKQRDSSKRGTR